MRRWSFWFSGCRLRHRHLLGASFFTEQDGTWHMTVIRDTDFTPSHIIEFYMSYRLLVIAVGAFFYAKPAFRILLMAIRLRS